MSDIKVATKRIALPNILGGTVDCTETDFGTVKGVLVFLSYSDGGHSINGQAMSIGAWDGTTQVCAFGYSQWGVTTSNTSRGYVNGSIARILAASNTIAAYSVSAITDGVRFTIDISGTSINRYATVIMFGGADCQAKVGDLTMGANELMDITGVGFRPQTVFFGCSGIDATTVTSQNIMSFGVAGCRNGMQNRAIAWFDVATQAVMKIGNYISNIFCVGQYFSDSVNWYSKVTAMTDDGFQLLVTGDALGDSVWYLALDMDTYNAMIQDISARSGVTGGSGIDHVTGLGFKPSHILACIGIFNSYNTHMNYNSISIGVSDGTNEASLVVVAEDNVSRSNTWNYSGTKLIDMKYATSGDLTIANVDSFHDDGFDLNYTAVHSTSNYLGWTVAFQTEESPRAVGAVGHKFLLLELA